MNAAAGLVISRPAAHARMTQTAPALRVVRIWSVNLGQHRTPSLIARRTSGRALGTNCSGIVVSLSHHQWSCYSSAMADTYSRSQDDRSLLGRRDTVVALNVPGSMVGVFAFLHRHERPERDATETPH